MQNWSCMHLCGHSSVKFLWSCDARAQDSFPLFYSNQCFQKMFFYPFVHSSESIWASGKIFTAFTLQVYTHFFQKLAMFGEFSFQTKVGNHLFQKHVGSLSSIFFRSLIRSFVSFFFFLFYFLPFFAWEFSFFAFCFRR